MMSTQFPFHPVSFSSSSTPFSAFNWHAQPNSMVPPINSAQTSMESHSQHFSLATSPAHSQVHDYSDSLSVSHSSIPFPSANRITANEFGCDTLEVEDTPQTNKHAHLANPFAAYTPFTSASQTAASASSFPSFGSSTNNTTQFHNFTNAFQPSQTATQSQSPPQPQHTGISSSTPFTFSQRQGDSSSSSSSSPFTQSNAQNSAFSMSQLTNNNFKLFSSQSSNTPASSASAAPRTMASSPSPSSSPASPTPSSSSSSSSASSSSSSTGVASFFQYNISEDVLQRRPVLADILARRKNKRPLDCLDSPALLRALHPKMARTDGNTSGKVLSTQGDDDEKENLLLPKNDNASKDDINSSSQMQEEVKKPARPSAASSSVSTQINRRRRAEDMDSAPAASSSSASSGSSSSVVKRSRNNEDGQQEGRRRRRDADEPNPFPAHDYSKDDNITLPRAKKVNAAGEPVYTLLQVKKIVLEALKSQETELREEYDFELHRLLEAQFESISNFNRDYYLKNHDVAKEANQPYIS